MPSPVALALGVLAPTFIAFQTYRVTVNAVRVDVFVGQGRKAILDLTIADFALYDNDVLQTIERIETKGLAVNVVLALDTSHSVRGEKLEDLKSAARALLEGLDAKDGAAVVTFSSIVKGTTAFEGPLDPLFAAVDEADSFGSTSLNDGVYAALKLAEGVERPLVVIFTDGEDRFSWLDGNHVLETARKSEATIFAVTTHSDQEGFALNRVFLSRLCELSGGELYEARSTGDLAGIFREILARAKTRYVLTYFPKDPRPGWHSLRVDSKARRAEVRARRGYYYTPP